MANILDEPKRRVVACAKLHLLRKARSKQLGGIAFDDAERNSRDAVPRLILHFHCERD